MDKRRLATALTVRVVNPLVSGMMLRGLPTPGYALLETIGRKSGIRRQTPVGDGLDGDTFWIVSEHGRRSAYVLNIEANPRVRVKVRGRWRPGVAQVVPDDDIRARQRRIGRMNGAVVRALGTDNVTVRIDLD
ncbi:MAG TPA: nitroreductase/quinone reductase family protein [Thermoleophilaceae bacterium]